MLQGALAGRRELSPVEYFAYTITDCVNLLFRHDEGAGKLMPLAEMSYARGLSRRPSCSYCEKPGKEESGQKKGRVGSPKAWSLAIASALSKLWLLPNTKAVIRTLLNTYSAPQRTAF